MDLGKDRNWYRKLSYSIQMSSPREYEGGEVTISGSSSEKWKANKQKGTMTIFPSFMQHRVSPVTVGTRRALVGWIGGPPWR